MRTMKALSIGLLCLATIAIPAAQRPTADNYLDVAGHTYTGPTGTGAFMPGRKSSSWTSGVRVDNNLRLTLMPLERTDFVLGESFTYEVFMENIGKTPVTLPWSPDRGAFVQPAPRTPDGFISGSVYLQVESADGQQSTLSLLEVQPLYGSNEVPRSRLVSHPDARHWSGFLRGGAQ